MDDSHPDPISATEARVRFGEVLRRVSEEGARYVVERGGRQTVVILSLEAYEMLVAAARPRGGIDEVLEAAAALRAAQRERLAGELPPPPERVIAEGREARDADLR